MAVGRRLGRHDVAAARYAATAQLFIPASKRQAHHGSRPPIGGFVRFAAMHQCGIRNAFIIVIVSDARRLFPSC